MSEDWAAKAFWFLVIWIVVGLVFTWLLGYVMKWPDNAITGFLIGLVGAGAFAGVALKK
jgi:hypothetical protein